MPTETLQPVVQQSGVVRRIGGAGGAIGGASAEDLAESIERECGTGMGAGGEAAEQRLQDEQIGGREYRRHRHPHRCHATASCRCNHCVAASSQYARRAGGNAAGLRRAGHDLWSGRATEVPMRKRATVEIMPALAGAARSCCSCNGTVAGQDVTPAAGAVRRGAATPPGPAMLSGTNPGVAGIDRLPVAPTVKR